MKKPFETIVILENIFLFFKKRKKRNKNQNKNKTEPKLEFKIETEQKSD